jgi:hypothetical protein
MMKSIVPVAVAMLAVASTFALTESKALAATYTLNDFRVVRTTAGGQRPYAINKIYIDFELTSGGGNGVVDGSVYYKMPPQTWWSYLTGPVGGEPGVGPNGTVRVTDVLIDLPRSCPYKLNIWFNGQWVNNPGDQASP